MQLNVLITSFNIINERIFSVYANNINLSGCICLRVKDLFVNGCSVQVHIEFSITQSDGHTEAGVPRKTPPRSGNLTDCTLLTRDYFNPGKINTNNHEIRLVFQRSHCCIYENRGTTRFRKVEGKLDRFSRGKLSVVYCVITWTCLPRRDSRNLGRKERYVARKGIL